MRNAKSFIQGLGMIVLLCGFSIDAWASVIRVKANATGANNGTSWTNAYTDLQAALAAAQWGDEIWVAAGTYKPTTGTDPTKSFLMTAGVAIYGGFAGTETTRSQRVWAAHPTILSGDIGVQGDSWDNSYHVVAGAYLATLDGFTVSGGYAFDRNGGGMINDSITSLTVTNCTFSGNSADHGGGMYNYNSSPNVTNCIFSGNSAIGPGGGGMYNGSKASPRVTNCTFSGNSAIGYYNGGGGLFNDANASSTIINCTFSGNSAGTYGGGGIYNYANCVSMTATNCTFSNNSATGTGGGINNLGKSATVTNCTFSGNSAGYGGGIYNYASCVSMTATNCTFSGNSADHGGGMYNYGDSLTVTNCTFSGNSATDGGGMLNDTNASLAMTNCILWGNIATTGPEIYKTGGTPTFCHCAIKGSGGSGSQWNTVLGTDGGGNIMADPLFMNVTNPAGTDGIWRTSDDGLRLQTGSPCINAGLATGAPATDILGNSRVGAVDIGAYEYAGSTPTPTPPTTPEGRLALSYTITKASTAPAGKTVQYTYKWTSDKGDSVTHGPTTALTDTLTEMDLVQAGETWTVTVTPSHDTTTGTPTTAKVKILSTQNNVNQWILYK